MVAGSEGQCVHPRLLWRVPEVMLFWDSHWTFSTHFCVLLFRFLSVLSRTHTSHYKTLPGFFPLAIAKCS